MWNLRRIVLTLLVLFVLSSGVAASNSVLSPFSTTGYTTNLVTHEYPIPDLPPMIPSEFEFLPSGHIKFHISAQGSTGDPMCVPFGKSCGTVGFFDGGSFMFEEWGISYPDMVIIPSGDVAIGANYGDMLISTDNGQADVRFAGQALVDLGTGSNSVSGNFEVLGGTDNYKNLEGQGTYAGDADFVFTVEYQPCNIDHASDDSDSFWQSDSHYNGSTTNTCPINRCAVFGGPLDIGKKMVTWQIENRGENSVTIDRITFNWADGDGVLQKVKLDGKMIHNKKLSESSTNPFANGRYGIIDSAWKGKAARRQISAGETGELALEFIKPTISPDPWDYTILVEFSEGCAATFVDFETYWKPDNE